VKHNHPSQRVTLIHSRNELLSNEPLPSDFKERALIILGEEGVDVTLNQRAIVETTENAEETVSTITLSNGEKITANHIIWATSKNVPNTNCIPQEILDDNGFVKVTQELHFEDGVANPTSHFAIGDVIHREGGIRRAGGALFMGRIAAVNIYRDMLRADGVEDDTPADIFPHFGPVMGLAVGSQMVGYTGEMGIKWGREYMAENFGTDLGWKGTLRHLGLPEEDEADGKKTAEL
jgi:apoptosis-inducing factor 2